jgi:hypothetical protein
MRGLCMVLDFENYEEVMGDIRSGYCIRAEFNDKCFQSPNQSKSQ